MRLGKGTTAGLDRTRAVSEKSSFLQMLALSAQSFAMAQLHYPNGVESKSPCVILETASISSRHGANRYKPAQ